MSVELSLKKKNDLIYISMPYNYQAIKMIKTIPGYRYDVIAKMYTVPDTPVSVNKLIDLRSHLQTYEEQNETVYDISDLSQYATHHANNIEGLEDPQALLLRKLNYHGKQLIADHVGYGKTIEAISFIRDDVANRTPFLLIIPANLKLQWFRELTKWVKYSNIEILDGETPKKLEQGMSYIINYEIVQYWYKDLHKLDFKTCIIDECVAICNEEAKRTKCIRGLCKKNPNLYLFGLSATPWRSRPSQLWVMLNLLSPDVFPNKAEFINMFCERKQKAAVRKSKKGKISYVTEWVECGCKNVGLLSKLMHPIVTRREKTTHEPRRIPLYFQVDTKVDREFFKKLKKDVVTEQECDKIYNNQQENSFFAKADSIIEWVNSIVDSGEKIILFAWHHSVIDYLQKAFEDRAVVINGNVSMKKRDEIVDKFRNEADILIGNWQATGVGIDGLHKICRICAFVELPKLEYDVTQAIGRLDRRDKIGNVLAYFPMGYDTFDVPAYESLVRTGETHNSIMGECVERDFVKLFNDYMERN